MFVFLLVDHLTDVFGFQTAISIIVLVYLNDGLMKTCNLPHYIYLPPSEISSGACGCFCTILVCHFYSSFSCNIYKNRSLCFKICQKWMHLKVNLQNSVGSELKS